MSAAAAIAPAQTTRPSVASIAGQPPVRLIFDTDMDSDCDDAGALGILNALADLGEVQPLAVMTSSLEPHSAACISAINTYYGRGSLPIGTARAPAPTYKSKYTGVVADKCPHPLKNATDAPDAVSLYRQILSQQPDGSVTLLTLGDMTNPAKLMQDPKDVDLVKRKIKLWVCMGGNFIGHPAKDDLKLGNNNFTIDAKATYQAITNWPGPIVYAGREMCSVPSGLQAGARLSTTSADNPVRIAYEAYLGGPSKNRHIADLVATVFAVRGLGDNWDAEPGAMDLHKNMTFEWRYDLNRPQAYLLKKKVNGQSNDHQIEKMVEDLLIRPPATKPAN